MSKSHKKNIYRRQIINRKYEILRIVSRRNGYGKGSEYIFDIKFRHHIGFFTPSEIFRFKECKPSLRTLTQRLLRLSQKIGKLTTLEQVITTPQEEKAEYKNELSPRQKKDKEEMDFYNNAMINLFKVGSLHEEALIIQSKVIK